ncbi:hypothetical protein AK830_g7513 [Neonectria ditissima]|uniref:Ubiquitin carboxyl-terminal hydrolase n=1 Tax=Neonectria ditissima TaxID=78410 RepID=A0A0P7BA40_9HYPO|nr:hypothetical protein AK830_g7513 [Neonectria ditissima]
MSNRHLPAGQNMQGGVGGMPSVDMAGGLGGGPRRRQPPPYVPQYHHQPQHQPQHQHQHQYQHQPQHPHQHQQHVNPMYGNYMPYAPQQYYGMPPQYQNGQYQNGGMPQPGYVPYQNYARSPPTMHQYVPMAGVTVPPSYPRHAQQSPALSTPYQPPPVPAAIPPQTPSSTHSSQVLPPPTSSAPQTREPTPSVVPARQPSPVEVPKEPFRAPLPWLSRPDLDFPVRTAKSRRRRKPLNANSQAVSLPVEQHEAAAEQMEQSIAPKPASKASSVSTQPTDVRSETTPTRRQPAGETIPSIPTTPSSIQQRSRTNTATSATPTTASKPATRGAHPAPAVPTLPKGTAKDSKPSRAEKPVNGTAAIEAVAQDDTSADVAAVPAEEDTIAPDCSTSPPAKAAPTSWANLFAKSSAAAAAAAGVAGPNGSSSGAGTVNGHDGDGVVGGTNGSGPNFLKVNASSAAEAIRAYHVGSGDKISFLEPRGLINTGNMCYMNSVLQVLMFCVPFYDFLNQVSQRAVHSFKSETPLIDAMIMFMHEYKLIKSAPSVEALRRALKNEELERYGEPFTPEFVYEAIRQLSRFASMRRGHQQDAEEFLGFLLQSLDDECTSVMGSSLFSGISEDGSATTGQDDWLEVGRKQRAAVTRSAGSNLSTPITKIFGGLLRSEFRVPGLKDSITTEPYQPLQLDIGAPDVRNVVDALRGLTRPERMQGNFNSPRGKDVTATKQVFIESLPPVLILHLKRFQFDAEGNGTVKIWKNVGYPLDLEIPREVLSRQARQSLDEGAVPKYKLISVVYHHGKNASGGHYTVDVRRQEGKEWIRLDDTVIRRVRSEDVAEGGEEEEVKDTRNEKPASGASGNRFGAMMDEDTGDEDGWKQVTTTPGGNKRWSSVVNGASNGTGKGKQAKDNMKDNKVAYLLFYQRV